MTSSDRPEPDGASVIRALFAAHNDGRLDDMLRLVDPTAVWEPATRPGRSFYLGKDGTLGLFTDIRSRYGEHRVECDEFEDLGDGQIRVTGAVIRTAPGADPPVVRFTTVVTIRDAHVVKLVSQPEDLRATNPSESGTTSS